MEAKAAVPAKFNLKKFRSPKTVILRFVARRSFKSSLILGLVLGFYVIVKASSFIKSYPTAAARQKLAETLGTNVGIEALLGIGHHVETVAGYLTWNFLCLIAAAGAIWALLIASRTFRGEEDNGRWELLLAGQTTNAQATINAFLGLLADLLLIFVILLLSLLTIGKLHGANLNFSGSLFFAGALISSIAEFLAIGLLTSQLLPVRSRAVALAVGIFGVFYSLRLIADTTSAHWLLNLTPLGWIERLQPLYASDAIWFVPIVLFVLITSSAAVYLASKRDLGAALLADKDTAKPHKFLLKSPVRVALRLNRTVMIGWLLVISLAGFLYGLLAKAAAKALTQSTAAAKIIGRLDHSSQTKEVSAFVGIIFFIIMVLASFYASNSVGRIREDEAEGYLDNFLVRKVSRLRWLWGRLGIVFCLIAIMAVATGLATWLGLASQHSSISIRTLLLAGINAMVPTIFIIGSGMIGFALKPRLTSLFTYGLVGEAFLISMLSSGLNINHWILDLSLLHQVSLAPAVSPNWTVNGLVVAIGLIMCLIGSIGFNRRDLQPN